MNKSPILLDYQKRNMTPPTTTNNNETSPHPDKGSDNMTSNEVILANLNQGEDMPPVPSTCDDAAGGVVRPIPSNTVTPRVASALARDMSSDPSSCDLTLATSARDMPAPVFGPKIKSTRMAPNRVVNWNDLKSTVDSHLGKCNDCKGSGLYLAEKSTCSFATTLEVVCNECNEDKEVNRLEISYLKKKINNSKTTTKKERDNLRILQLKHNYKICLRKIRPYRVESKG